MSTEKDSRKGQRYTFEFTLSGLVSLFVFAVLIMVWMFILGILVGRGYPPETIIPQLARVLPQEQAAQPTTEQQSILRPEELNFHEELRKTERRPSPPSAPQQPRPAAKAPEPAKPSAQQAAPLAKPEAAPVKAESAPAKAESAPAKVEPAGTKETAPQAEKFRYIYQVAAFKEEDRAAISRDHFLGKGFSAFYAESQVNSETWFRVMVTLDGTLEEIDQRKAALEKLAGKTPLLRSKKPL